MKVNGISGHFWVILTTITIVITAVFQPEFLLLTIECSVVSGGTITPGNHATFKPTFKYAYPNIWIVDFFKKLGKFQAVSGLNVFYEGR